MNWRICTIVARRMKRGGIMFFAMRPRASAIASSILRAHLTEPRDVVLGVFLGDKGMVHSEEGRHVDVDAAELLERKLIVLVLLRFDQRVQLPLHQVGRHTLGLRHPCAIERRQLGQALLREQDDVVTRRRRVRRELRLEPILLGAREISGRRGLVRVRPHPLGGEIAEEIGDRARRPRRFTLRRQADDSGDGYDEDECSHRSAVHCQRSAPSAGAAAARPPCQTDGAGGLKPLASASATARSSERAALRISDNAKFPSWHSYGRTR